jgi:hypothetical protein
MASHRIFLLGLAAIAGFARPARALEWKTKTLTAATAPFQTTYEARFDFRNAGTKPVAVRDLETNCNCLAVDTDLKVYAPGAAGIVRATFTVGDRTGLYERTITVVTDEADSPVRLVLKIEVPEVASLAPRSVLWQLHESAAEKSVELHSAQGLAINFAEAQATNEAFAVRLETVVPGRHYRLHLKPRDTARPASAAIRIFGREKSGHDVVVSAYASVE